LRGVFAELVAQGVALGAMILKANMVLPGMASTERPTAGEVAEATVRVLRRVVPVEFPEQPFHRGGQSGELASARLNAMNSPVASASVTAPWELTFSYARAIQQPALQIWAGKDANRPETPTGVAPPCDLQPHRPPRPV
jgi:fructose-bisphosphate aldolase class I